MERRKQTYFDYSLLFIIIFLVMFGLIMLYSASAYEAQTTYDDPMHFVKHQCAGLAIGAVFMVVAVLCGQNFIKAAAPFMYIAAIALNLLVITSGSSGNGSTRWLRIGELSFQPSEFAKIALIIFMAAYLAKNSKELSTWKGIAIAFAYALPLIVMIAVSNLSTAIICCGIVFVMMFVCSKKYSNFLLILVLLGGTVLIYALTSGYRATRIAAWLHPEDYVDDTYQTLQGLYAIGSGGFFGNGIGSSVQKLGVVPEAQNDFIFAIICEELGLFGGICVILLFVLLLWRMMVIANNAVNLMDSVIVVGVMTHVALQVILNIAVVTNFIPNTGVTLPFFSYGGTSMVFLVAEIGLVLGVSRRITLEMKD